MPKTIIRNDERIIDNHSKLIGYLLWFFGFLGVHRFYYGKQISGTIWLFTGGLAGIGWIVDFFLIPSMDDETDIAYWDGDIQYNVAWVLLVLVGYLGFHRLYMGKIGTGILYLCTGGLFGIGIIYDFWTLNDQINEINVTRTKSHIG
ncbi:putative membrane protein [Halobacteriovorax marinus SJ]|uniref:Membrane protein n=1 Tax=Halobacteriovorax marinus (strain ATCC BAA-682 / DSM 15412 / SJ) TaxID=862908 RepID=E1WYC0_HALMS|nr:TM2 domain-containing protein [Halobacteriovorax marinus]CBW25968.1 putative membrane protein [Halobacteriovorax marinus SJ]